MSRHVLVRLLVAVTLAAPGSSIVGARSGKQKPVPWTASGGLLLHGTVVSMDAARSVIEDGRVLVRNGRIVAVWSGDTVPQGVSTDGASVVGAGEDALIFPGLINLHDHPLFDVLPVWTPPSAHRQATRGRPLGTEPYANRYDWNIQGVTSPAEYLRLVSNPNLILTAPEALNLSAEVVKYAEIKALLGGATAMQGAPPSTATDTILVRNVDNVNFGRDRVDNRVTSIASLNGSALASVISRMRSGQLDAWLVHLAEGVRDGARRPGDATSSRAEFQQLRAKGLLSDATVVVHGTGLESEDFAAMASAPSLRTDGHADGLGAKLVWSPLSNLLLYGQTANVYEALAAGVTVSLGTDWSPSGSPNLLTELKVADIALRDERILGSSRHVVADLATGGLGHERRAAERLLDQRLVEMVTVNPARTLRWDAEVGSVEAGKAADILMIRQPRPHKRGDVPKSVYRALIDATERDVALVMVDGEPLAGALETIAALKPADHEKVSLSTPGSEIGVDATRPGVPRGTQTLSTIAALLDGGLRALGGDNPPAEGGQSDDTNTYSYLKARFRGTSSLSDAQFRAVVLVPFIGTAGGRLNLERMSRAPLVTEEDDWLLAILEAAVDGSGLVADSTPPYRPYESNFNHVAGTNPFGAKSFHDRWFGGR